jgi:type VII secretion integral membrane protein EccD
MSASLPSLGTELCRVTVIGPQSKADLAIPLSATVANLLPVLLQHTAQEPERGGAWVLQRLGEPPLDPDGTVDTLGLRDGDELYLRPVDDPLPELDFDDLADGVGDAMSRRSDLWRPQLTRQLFLGLAAFTSALLLAALAGTGAPLPAMVYAGAAALVALLASGLIAWKLRQRDIATVTGLSGCALAALAGSLAPQGIREAENLEALRLLFAGTALAVSAACVLLMRKLSAPVFGTVLLVGLFACLSASLVLVADASTAGSAGLVASGALVVMVAGPRLSLRLARLTGPQLPRRAEELQEDIEPEQAERVLSRTDSANGFLCMFAVSSSVVIAAALAVVQREPGWVPAALAVLFALAVFLRARESTVIWQRLPAAVAGAVCLALVVHGGFQGWGPLMRGVAVVALMLLVAALLLASARLPARRPLPIWRRTAEILETLSALAILPLVGQLLGIYGYLRGLNG